MVESAVKTVLVTGGAGYIGSHCALTLLQAGYDVVAFDNFSNAIPETDRNDMPPALERVQQLAGKTLTFEYADMCSRDDMRRIFTQYKFECVMHFAGLKAVGDSVDQPFHYYDNNIMGLVEIVRMMREFDVHHMIFSSSCTVYGDPESLPITERSPIGACTNPYGRTKYFQEIILKDICHADQQFSAICLRYFNPIGAHPSGLIGEDPQGIPTCLSPYVAQVAVGKLSHVRVYGSDYPTKDGTGVRDYLHIMDLARGHVDAVRLIERKGTVGYQYYNLGTGRGYTVLEVIAAFEKACGKKIPYKLEPRRSGDASTVYCDASDLAAKELGWRAEYDIDDMCAHMYVQTGGDLSKNAIP